MNILTLRETHILTVPLGPRLVFITSWRPLAALMLMQSAASAFMTSALALRLFREEDAIFNQCCKLELM